MSKRAGASLLSLFAAALLAAGCKCSSGAPEPAALETATKAAPAPATTPVAKSSYVGSERCRDCHATQYSAWQGSQHRVALQLPSPEAVLGDFTGGSVGKLREPTRFHRDGSDYRVDTLGKTYDVKYTFGVRPLQQYLLDVGQGRLQALTVAYDTRPKEAGGGRWYQLQPHERTQPGDELHWTAAAYNWNAACADCHSTQLQKNYDSAHDRYSTTFSEPSVGCEACHGPASLHVEQAAHGTFSENHGFSRHFVSPRERHWTFSAPRPIAALASGSPASNELDACSACHAHRADLGGDALAFDDRYRIDLLNAGLYEVDGQQKEESFELGSFLQSKMFAAGVVCSDCHEPHAAALRRSGNALCGGCHDAQHYDTPAHHLHTAGTLQSQCVTCHMPTHTFMEIDARREHRFNVPRPDLTLSLGVPNPCTDACHAEKRRGNRPSDTAASWASGVIREHFGPTREPSIGPALAAGRALSSDGQQELLSVVQSAGFAAIGRATALLELRNYPELRLSDVAALARDPSPLLRRAFAELLGERSADERRTLLPPLLSDPVRSVRLEAARQLLSVPSLSESDSAALERVLPDLQSSLEHNADRAGALLGVAALALRRGKPGERDSAAETLFTRAEALEPSLAASYLNHADFLRQRSRDAEAIEVLQRGLQKCRDRAPLEHALGLAEIRRGDKRRGLEHLRRAFELAPDSGQLGYVYAVALHDTGNVPEALKVLERLHHAAPSDQATLQLLERYRADVRATGELR